MILAIDPGREKSGLVIVDSDCQVLEQKVVPTVKLKEIIFTFAREYVINKLVLGNGTASSMVEKILDSCKFEVELIDETNSTIEGEKLYWLDNPPQGWRKLLPTSLQKPQLAIDDYAALVLAKRYLEADNY